MSNTKALPGKYSCEPVHGSLCATISIQLTRIHRKNTIVSIKSKFFVAFKINFFMITSFSFLETMLKCVCFWAWFPCSCPISKRQLRNGLFCIKILFRCSLWSLPFQAILFFVVLLKYGEHSQAANLYQ